MKLTNFSWLLIIVIFLGCAAKKTQNLEVNNKELEEFIEKRSFEIVSDWAQPLATNTILKINNAGLLAPGSNAGSISLIGNTNYLQIKDNKVKAYLPFYGERHMGGSYSNIRSGIQFDAEPQDYEVKKGKKNSYEVSFKVSDTFTPNENYLVQIQVFPNLYSVISINSAHRSYIQYRGKASSIKLEDK